LSRSNPLLPQCTLPMPPGTSTAIECPLAGPNSLAPDQMTADARLAELGRIIAAGVLRMRAKSTPISADLGDSSLAILPTRSVSRPRPKARIGGR
jgi:hypothetical protein